MGEMNCLSILHMCRTRGKRSIVGTLASRHASKLMRRGRMSEAMREQRGSSRNGGSERPRVQKDRQPETSLISGNVELAASDFRGT